MRAAPRDLLRRPVLRQPATSGRVDLRIVHLPHQRTFPPPPLGLPLGLAGAVFVARAIASQLATDRRRGAAQGRRDVLLRGARVPQLRYAIALFPRKMH